MAGSPTQVLSRVRRGAGLATLLLLASQAWDASGQGEPACQMTAPARTVALPERGLAWLPGQDFTGPCPEPTAPWERARVPEGELLVSAVGPEGSGRHWTVTVAVLEKGTAAPTRGVCLAASTRGWRTLREFEGAALPWLEDGDGDGRAELVLWSSYEVAEGESPATAGLVAWAYELSGPDLRLDLPATRRLAARLATAYRRELAGQDALLARVRGRAADQLQALADGRCRVELDAGAPATSPTQSTVVLQTRAGGDVLACHDPESLDRIREIEVALPGVR